MDRYSKIVLLLIVCLLATSCGSATPTPTQEQQEAAIYALLLNRDPEGYIRGTPLVISAETEYFDIDNQGYWDKMFPTLRVETLEAYRIANRTTQTIDIPLTPREPYVYVSKSELRELIGKSDNWEKFNQIYPDTHVITYFSKIGFNTEGDQALVYMGHTCGGECGIGSLYLLSFDGNAWRIEKFDSVVVS